MAIVTLKATIRNIDYRHDFDTDSMGIEADSPESMILEAVRHAADLILEDIISNEFDNEEDDNMDAIKRAIGWKDPDEDEDDEPTTARLKAVIATLKCATDLRSPLEREFGLEAGEAYGADEEVHTELKSEVIDGVTVEFSLNENTGTYSAWAKGLGPLGADFRLDDLKAALPEAIKRKKLAARK